MIVLVFAPIIAAVDWSGWVGGAANGPRPESLALQPSQQFRLRAFPRWRQRRRQAVRIPRCDLSFRGPIKALTELASPYPHVELSGLKRPDFAGCQQSRRLAFGTTRGPQRPAANAMPGWAHVTAPTASSGRSVAGSPGAGRQPTFNLGLPPANGANSDFQRLREGPVAHLAIDGRAPKLGTALYFAAAQEAVRVRSPHDVPPSKRYLNQGYGMAGGLSG